MERPLVRGSGSHFQLIAAGLLANAVAGLIYVWSLFILPLETALDLDRWNLGVISSVSLACYTFGIWVLPRMTARLGLRGTAMLAFGLIGAGHFAFGIAPSGWTLAAGYGLAFGTGAGLAYGLALTLASRVPDALRARTIGLVLAAFALSGIVLPLLLGDWIAKTDPAFAFRVIGVATLLPGGACTLLLPRGRPATMAGPATSPATPAPDFPFVIMSGIFFCLCFVGLVLVSQGVAMASSSGLADPSRVTTAMTLGYLVASLFGAPLADVMRERSMLALLAGVCALGVAGMGSASDLVFLAGSTLVGLSFGGSGSVLPVLVGRRYGAAQISAVYGRMIIAYGLAGLIAPGLAGALYAAQASYGHALVLSLILAALSFAAAVLIPLRPVSGVTAK
jgi:MFS family permease